MSLMPRQCTNCLTSRHRLRQSEDDLAFERAKSIQLQALIRSLQQDQDALQQKLDIAESEVERLKAGDFTRDEIHSICHNLPSTVPREEFEEGCRLEQERLYGKKE